MRNGAAKLRKTKMFATVIEMKLKYQDNSEYCTFIKAEISAGA